VAWHERDFTDISLLSISLILSTPYFRSAVIFGIIKTLFFVIFIFCEQQKLFLMNFMPIFKPFSFSSLYRCCEIIEQRDREQTGIWNLNHRHSVASK
jgi:hypothetical protein